MNKKIAFLFAGLCAATAFAGMDNVVISFSTVGPDKYADGSTVMDGECYALVWTPNGETFAGINAEGKAVGKSKVAIKAPVAKDGKCPNVLFQIDEGYANTNYPGGTWGVYLLDTRKFATEKVKVVIDGVEVEQTRVNVDANGNKVATGVGGAVSGYGEVSANVGRTLAAAGAKDGIVQSIPAGIQPPTVTDFKVINDMVYLYLKNTSSGTAYGVAAGQAPDTLAPVVQSPVMGGEGGETIIVTPKTGDSGFFQGIVR